MPKGKLIVIDGTDGSGKATQTKLLVKKLRADRIPVVDLDFPQYQTFFGRLVVRYLNNEFGRIDPHLASVLYAINRFEFREKIASWLKRGRIVVLNRYVSSNQIHQAAHIKNRNQRNKFVQWIGRMEYGVLGLPKPNLVIFLNIPPEISYQLIAKKDARSRKYIAGAKRDILESDLEHQRNALKQSLYLFKNGYNWQKIDCVKAGKVLLKEEISKKVYETVLRFIK